ncbi:MFS transporter [Streptomyces misionensis]|uniref:MFS transporter n=1 Tax=Streptomyces misionensis TaxID=67331 RepID=UPI00340BA125
MHDVRPVASASLPRLAAASLAGAAVEFYDFFAYGTAAALVLGRLFFPSFSPLAGTLAAFATFGVGFVARPLGSVLFGHLGDRRGRRPVLVASLLLTGGSTIAVGCVPPYASIGVAAPVLLLLLRFVQGLGLGGEWGAVLLTVEHAPAERRTLWSSFPQAGPAIGFLLANGVMVALSAGLSDAQFAQWGWRVPFWVAAVPVLAGLWLRASLAESPRFLEIDAPVRMPLVEVVRRHGRLVLLAAGAMAAGYAVFYTVTTWSLSYATERLGMSRTVMLTCVMAAVVVQAPLVPAAALLGDRCGRRPMCLTGCALCALWMLPMVALLATGEPLLMFFGILGALLAFVTVFAVISAYLPELFEARVRCTGASVGYNLGGIIGGALTPVVATALAQGSGRVPWGVGVYLTVMALFSMGCFALLPETRPSQVPAVEPVTTG